VILDPNLDIETPHHSDCGTSGVCKSPLMEQLQIFGSKSIYIGDGFSDFCPSKKADMVFAKNILYKRPRLTEGMVITIEPMINEGTWFCRMNSNGWTARTVDGKLSAQYEHTAAITKDGPLVLTQQ